MEQLSLTWRVQKAQEGMLLKDFLREEHKISKRLLTDIKFHGGQMIVNSEQVTVRRRLKAGDTVTIRFPKEERSPGMKPHPMKLDIVYEDEHVLVLNKPAQLQTIPSKREPDRSLAQGVLAYYDAQQITATVHVVTRLDRDTSGLVLIAKHRYAHSLLAKQQKDKQIDRYYLAIVEGQLQQKKGTIALPIARKEKSLIETTVDQDGQKAIAHFETISQTGQFSLVKIQLETGRTHQIRVHFSAMGHPIAGDDLYGGTKDNIARQALHCSALRFQHPILKETMAFESGLPQDMRFVIKRAKLFGKKRLF